jgi:hypothetical protein
MGHGVVLVTQAQIQSQLGVTELVLEITLKESSAISYYTLALQIGCRAGLIVNEIIC